MVGSWKRLNFSMPVMPTGIPSELPLSKVHKSMPCTSSNFEHIFKGWMLTLHWLRCRTYFMIWQIHHPKLVNGCCTTKYPITFFYFCKVWPTTKVLNFEKACTVAMLHSNCGHFLLAGGPARFVSGHMFLAVRMDYHQRVSLEVTWTLTRPQTTSYYSS